MMLVEVPFKGRKRCEKVFTYLYIYHNRRKKSLKMQVDIPHIDPSG